MNNIVLKPNAMITSFMHNVIVELARKYPDWIFKSNAPEEAHHFMVLHKDTHLGHIKSEHKYVRGTRHEVYFVSNWRIEDARQRGSGIQTSKPKEVFKAVSKYFYPLTTQEQVDSSFREAHHRISEQVRETIGELTTTIKTLQYPMLSFARANWDTFLESLDEKTKHTAIHLAEKQQVTNATKSLYDVMEKGNCLTVFISNGKYTVQDKEVVREYESESLPDDIKTKVGLLKLVENKQVLPDVGVRVDDVYVIRPYLPLA